MTETAGFTTAGLFGSPTGTAGTTISASAGASAPTTSTSTTATKTLLAAKTDALKPQPRTIARNDLDAEDDADGNDDDDAPSLKPHSHRQNRCPSKLPALRSADRQGGSAASSFPSQPSRPHSLAVPSSPVSPNSVPQQGPSTPSRAAEDNDDDGEAASKQHPQLHRYPLSAAADNSPPRPSPRSRASTYQTTPATSATATSPADPDRPARAKRPSSCPEANALDADQSSSLSRADAARSQARRAPASRSSHGVSTTAGPPPSLTTQRRHAAEAQSPSATPTAEWTPQGQRELLLPKRLSQSSSSDESRYSPSYRPPVSYKPPATSSTAQLGASAPVRVPPIRGFRSSGSRRSLVLDMNFRPRPFDLGEEYPDTSNDQTLRALEGRYGDDALQMTGSSPGRRRGSGADDAGDVFLRIAREEPTRRFGGDTIPDDAQSSVVSSATAHVSVLFLGCGHVVKACLARSQECPLIDHPTTQSYTLRPYLAVHHSSLHTSYLTLPTARTARTPASGSAVSWRLANSETVASQSLISSTPTFDGHCYISHHLSASIKPPPVRSARSASAEKPRRRSGERDFACNYLPIVGEREGRISPSRR